MAYQGLEMYENAMIAYADGLVADPKQGSMLHGLIEAMLKSPYRGMTSCNVYVMYVYNYVDHKLLLGVIIVPLL